MATATRASRRARVAFLISVFASLVATHLPLLGYLAYPFMLASTTAHELGHGLAAVAVGGRFESLHVYADGSGVARSEIPERRLARAVVAAGGLLGPAFFALLLFGAGRRPRSARLWLGVASALLLLVALGFVRNTFGFVFVTALATVGLLLAWQASEGACQAAVVFLATQLAVSVFTRADYLFVPVARTATGLVASDVTQIADALFPPYWLWGLICGTASIAALAFGLRVALRLGR